MVAQFACNDPRRLASAEHAVTLDRSVLQFTGEVVGQALEGQSGVLR